MKNTGLKETHREAILELLTEHTDDPKFAVTYLQEKEILLPQLYRAPQVLIDTAWAQIEAGKQRLEVWKANR